jgi:hypothetical protein
VAPLTRRTPRTGLNVSVLVPEAQAHRPTGHQGAPGTATTPRSAREVPPAPTFARHTVEAMEEGMLP